ncbi:MAG: nucleoside hydrolase [Caldilineaceae bacterium SB0661_bin_32]|uniref:Nucleoside hydrolase n=1 Tax=Caldilineaceae bacterium SB0661_bin_32 TaxID=2605255 RepID=A0A6B1D5A6_9CHLR|nr:nucleoside hydrolase [Caldilineaceae bacterium SB0661_bin_32]
MTNALPVLLDVDTGGDDALALLLATASPALDVRGITCVAGNCALEQVVSNTLTLLDAIGAPPVPVAAGMDRPILEPGLPAPPLHGRDGMGDLGLPAPRRSEAGVHAVEFLRRTLADSAGPMTLICLAPLTNIAMLLRLYPRIEDKIERLYVMGGTFAAPGNTTPAAEFNVRYDPEAAAIVLHSGLPVTLYPLDPFVQVRFTVEEARKLTQAKGAGARIAGGIALHYCRFFGMEFSLIGDAGTVATVIDPAGAASERRPVHVALSSGATRGATVFDRRILTDGFAREGEWTDVDVVSKVDATRYRKLMAAALGATEALDD